MTSIIKFLPVLVLHLIKDVCVCVHVCVCIHLSFTVSDIYPYCCTYQQFFLFIAEQYSIVGIYHNLFTHSLVDGYWGIQFQADMNKVAMDIPELIFNFSLLKKTYYLNKFQTYRKLQKLKQHNTLILFIQIYLLQNLCFITCVCVLSLFVYIHMCVFSPEPFEGLLLQNYGPLLLKVLCIFLRIWIWPNITTVCLSISVI